MLAFVCHRSVRLESLNIWFLAGLVPKLCNADNQRRNSTRPQLPFRLPLYAIIYPSMPLRFPKSLLNADVT